MLRIVSVLGRGDNDPIDVRNPTAVRNRRISILLLREIPLDILDE
jgi:flagellar motor protein MotB